MAELKAGNQAVHDLSVELSQMIGTYNQIKEQIKTLDGKDQEVRDIRSQEKLQFDKRQGSALK